MDGTLVVLGNGQHARAIIALLSTAEHGEIMANAHKLDCEAAENDCRFIVQSEDEGEAIELARNHMKDAHGKEYTDDELRSEHLQTVS